MGVSMQAETAIVKQTSSVQSIPKRSDSDPLLVCREREKLTILICSKSSLSILPDREEDKMNVGVPRKDTTESKLYFCDSTL